MALWMSFRKRVIFDDCRVDSPAQIYEHVARPGTVALSFAGTFRGVLIIYTQSFPCEIVQNQAIRRHLLTAVPISPGTCISLKSRQHVFPIQETCRHARLCCASSGHRSVSSTPWFAKLTIWKAPSLLSEVFSSAMTPVPSAASWP